MGRRVLKIISNFTDCYATICGVSRLSVVHKSPRWRQAMEPTNRNNQFLRRVSQREIFGRLSGITASPLPSCFATDHTERANTHTHPVGFPNLTKRAVSPQEEDQNTRNVQISVYLWAPDDETRAGLLVKQNSLTLK
ncbi:hypothetical protein RRG08_052124 [Elysia crispata]|uniref:Uncharacterized protein n=1 Tax=Elysia crispata TaxID=231223 RepID=A0AAE1DSC7_9GAST|nr:hypothetical protein RRG08_052124 [Elysia crispata]